MLERTIIGLYSDLYKTHKFPVESNWGSILGETRLKRKYFDRILFLQNKLRKQIFRQEALFLNETLCGKAIALKNLASRTSEICSIAKSDNVQEVKAFIPSSCKSSC